MSLSSQRIHREPSGPGSPAWRAKLRRALDGRPWLIVSAQDPQSVARDLLAELAGLAALTEVATKAELAKVAGAAERLYGMPIRLARAGGQQDAMAVARDFLAVHHYARALVQAKSPSWRPSRSLWGILTRFWAVLCGFLG